MACEKKSSSRWVEFRLGWLREGDVVDTLTQHEWWLFIYRTGTRQRSKVWYPVRGMVPSGCSHRKEDRRRDYLLTFDLFTTRCFAVGKREPWTNPVRSVDLA